MRKTETSHKTFANKQIEYMQISHVSIMLLAWKYTNSDLNKTYQINNCFRLIQSQIVKNVIKELIYYLL